MARASGLGVYLPLLGWFFLLSHFSYLLTAAMPEHSWAKKHCQVASQDCLHAPCQPGGATSYHFPVPLSLLLKLVSPQEKGAGQASASLRGHPLAVAMGRGHIPGPCGVFSIVTQCSSFLPFKIPQSKTPSPRGPCHMFAKSHKGNFYFLLSYWRGMLIGWKL